jgi:uncharacterized membrane protein YqjE
MKSIVAFLLNHGFTLMLIGMVTTIVGLLVLVNRGSAWMVPPEVARAVAATGVVIYVVGRVCVALERRQSRKRREQER